MGELKPCPFCGELPQAAGGTAMHACRVLDREMRVPVAAWNRRAERTCRMDAPIDGEYRCSECGHLNRETYRADKGWYPPKYCAHCGARAVGCDDASTR